MDLDKIAAGVRLILEGIGEDTARPGLADTPRRVAEMFEEICGGMYEDAAAEIKVIPGESHDDIVMVKDITIASICEHHLVPFTGVAHIAYIPKDGRIVGLSKLARIAEIFARRPQVQERLTLQIAETLKKKLNAHGVAVVMEARHLCMMMRGVEKQNTVAVSSSMLGVFRTQQQTREEFLKLIRGSSVRDGG